MRRRISQRLVDGIEDFFNGKLFQQKSGGAIRQRTFFGFAIEKCREHQNLRRAREGFDGANGVQPAGLTHVDVE